MKQKPNRFKLTPEIHNFIKETDLRLGEFQRRHEKTGELMWRTVTKFTGTTPGKKKNSVMNNYESIKEPILVNHQINLVAIYQKDGQAGMDLYIKFFKELRQEENKKKKAA